MPKSNCRLRKESGVFSAKRCKKYIPKSFPLKEGKPLSNEMTPLAELSFLFSQ